MKRLSLGCLMIAGFLTACDPSYQAALPAIADAVVKLGEAEAEAEAAAESAPSEQAEAEAEAAAESAPSEQAEALYDAMMAYRAEKGLASIPLSPSLTRVAQLHVDDLQAHRSPDPSCNLHSWSAHGSWTPVCYTSDHKQATGMWSKPRELTGYQGNGYEIAYEIVGAKAEPAKALAVWKKSAGHNAVIVNEGIWQDVSWRAIGVAINDRYAVAWFGKETDTRQ